MTEQLIRAFCILAGITLACVLALSWIVYTQNQTIVSANVEHRKLTEALIGELGYYAAANDRLNQRMTAWTNVWQQRQEHEAGARLREKQKKQDKDN